MPVENSMHLSYTYLGLAIVAEVVATSALNATDGLTRWQPIVLVVLGYGLAFFFLSLVLQSIPLGVTYAVWSGLGIILIAIVGAVVFEQIPDWPAVIGMTLIIAGVMVIHLFSNTVTP